MGKDWCYLYHFNVVWFQGRDIVDRVRQLLVRSEESLSHTNNAEVYWRVRKGLDNELKVVVHCLCTPTLL